MTVKCQIRTSEYHDSVSLMLVAKDLASMPDVFDAAAVMGTDANKAILREAGLYSSEITSATPNDLIIAINATDEAAQNALSQLDKILHKKQSDESQLLFRPRTIRSVLKINPKANMVVISVAGQYAVNEAWDALRQGLHVLLFSDNVSLQDELALKRYAASQGLLLMGPGAGTAIINHVALGFANVLPSGPVGIVSAAGTGLQEVSTLLANKGIGITQGFGTGGRDLKEEIGGIMMELCLRTLQEDPETKVIVLISKPPSPTIAQKIIDQSKESKKKTIICFLGQSTPELNPADHIQMARTLEEAAWLAADAIGLTMMSFDQRLLEEEKETIQRVQEMSTSLNTEQKYIRGLFSGGTLCYEAQTILCDVLTEEIYSNAPLDMKYNLPDSTKSINHSLVDLGEEEFTVGRPHPMIDNDLRIRRLLQEANDPDVAIILFDVVIGYGAHPDPANELANAVEKARLIAHKSNHKLVFIASITGTQGDPQKLTRQTEVLSTAGVQICESNAAASRLTAKIIKSLLQRQRNIIKG